MTRAVLVTPGEQTSERASWLRLARQQGSALVERQLAASPRACPWQDPPRALFPPWRGFTLAWAAAFVVALGLAGGTWALVRRAARPQSVVAPREAAVAGAERRAVLSPPHWRPATVERIATASALAPTKEASRSRELLRRERRRRARPVPQKAPVAAPRAGGPETHEMPDEVIIVSPRARLRPLFTPEDFVRRRSARP